MKNFLFLLSMGLSGVLLSQCPNSSIVLKTQAEVDAFAVNYPNCTQLTHELRVNGEESDIVNLEGLSGITNCQDIFILRTDITDLSGLRNLVSTDHLSIGFNFGLLNLTGLDDLQSVDELNVWYNGTMQSLDGAPQLSSVARVNIYQNSSLEDISELSDLQSVTSLSLAGNNLVSLNGLENLQAISEDLYIANEGMSHFNELQSLTAIGGSIFIFNHANLSDISVFQSITTVEDLKFIDCPSLASLNGLQNIEEVTGLLRLGFLPEITDLSIFQNLTSVGALDLYENQGLSNLNGLGNLMDVETSIYLIDNNNLNDISAIGDLDSEGLSAVVVYGNENLITCDYPLICNAIFDEDINDEISQNGTECQTSQQVAALCILGVDELDLQNQVRLFPNPTNDLIHIDFPSEFELKKVSLYSALGQKILEGETKRISLSNQASGIYFLVAEFDKGVIQKRLIKK